MPLIFSISGLRGIVGRDLTPHIIYQYAVLFGRYVKPGRVVVGRDARGSGIAFRDAVIQGLISADCSVVDLGIVPTPTVVFMVKSLKANGGIAVTASHNPSNWNALKFISEEGRFFNGREFKRFKRFIDGRDVYQEISSSGFERSSVDGVGKQITKIKHALRMDSKAGASLRVAVDAVNGAGSIALPELLEALGCRVYRYNCRFSSDFPRGPEPTPENIKGLCRFVKEKGLDLGFACDPDCDRLSVVDEQGRAVGEEKTLVLATDLILSRTKGNVVTNLSTTALMDFITKKYNCRLFRTGVGEANVVAKMLKVNGVIGGEGNGGVIYPRINLTRDALVGAALIIKLLRRRNKRLSEIIDLYPKYYMIKKKVRINAEIFERRKKKIIKKFPGRINTLDGLRITRPDYWLHIRPSQTEPLVRIIGEGVDKRRINGYIREIKEILS
ncbi:MAG TPA: phosphoglucosamine mutase [candidate division WOR-3 bacterium]|uniref:Phosphoglucosamine mutase n=1 Tax=candidate division WOR-3 bacterium TaxID=2052148 RepID=A0A9C9EP19_UNCW3|nr:phosphoglucosamine mutase [candidate division WOR-3 bacterium]